jgi:hypothetical protein
MFRKAVQVALVRVFAVAILQICLVMLTVVAVVAHRRKVLTTQRQTHLTVAQV